MGHRGWRGHVAAATSTVLALTAFVCTLVAAGTAPATASGGAETGLPGFADFALYDNASRYLVGAQAFVSFSSAAAHGAAGGNVTGHGLTQPEALCNCACYALDNFAYCQNTVRGGKHRYLPPTSPEGLSSFALLLPPPHNLCYLNAPPLPGRE